MTVPLTNSVIILYKGSDDLLNSKVMKFKEWKELDVTEFQKWVNDYYEDRGWSKLDIFIRIGFLAEETGEVARAIRALEIGRDRPDEVKDSFMNNRKELVEELGDVLGNVIVIANKYNISLEEVFNSHKEKLSKRYSQE